MTLAIMQPYLFPYIGYFQLINSVDKFIVYDDVDFIKQGFINRNFILLNNKKHLFFVPVKGISSYKKINETEVDYHFNWERKTLLTIEQAYKKAPYFKIIFPVIEAVLSSKKHTISELAVESVLKINDYLGIKTEIEKTSSVFANKHLAGKNRVLDICKVENTSNYINPIGGIELYSKEDFLNNGIKLNFIKPINSSYKQYNNEFIPWLSIIDVLMFNSIHETHNLLNQYELL